MKYVMFSNKISEHLIRKIPVIFPNELSHVDVANALLAGCPELNNATIVSAGAYENGSTHGGSTTLNLKAKEEDAGTILSHDYFHGLEDSDD